MLPVEYEPTIPRGEWAQTHALDRVTTGSGRNPLLTINPLTCRIWCAPNNASRWQMGFNSAFKGLTFLLKDV